IDLTPDDLSRNLSETLVTSLGPAILNCDIAAFDPTKFAQPLYEGVDPLPLARTRALPQKADSRQLARPLRPRRQRPRRRRAAEQRDELAPLHSITSSAVASSEVGTSMPSALAVVRLTTRSNLVGCSTGRSAGFTPRKILSTRSPARRNKSGKFGP